MEKRIDKQVLLDRIRTEEGIGFECDDQLLLAECQRAADEESTLVIKLLSIFGGLLATITFLAFLLLLGLYKSAEGMVLIGVGFIAVALILNRASQKLIIDTFSVSVYVAGLSLFAFGLDRSDIGESTISVILMLIAMGSLLVMQRYILSFIAVLVINSSLLLLIFINDMYGLIHVYVSVNVLLLSFIMLNEAKLITTFRHYTKLYDPIRIGLVISLFFGFDKIGWEYFVDPSAAYVWVSSLIVLPVVLYLIWLILKTLEVRAVKDQVIVYGLTILIAAATIYSPIIMASIIVILLCFHVQYKTGLVIGVVALIYAISRYYYDLNLTLLTKSVILMGAGIVFGYLYLLINKKMKADEKI